MNSRKQTRPQFSSVLRTLLLEQRYAILLFVLLAVALHVCYPDPYVTADSGEYMNSAMRLANNPYRPIGYPLFLALVHLFTSSAQVISLAQMLVYLAGVLYFIRQIDEVVHLSKQTRVVLGVLLMLNPLPWLYTLHILSDSLFSTLTLCFVGSVIRYSKDGSTRALVYMIVWSGLSVIVRHAGLFYMVFAATVIVWKLRKKSLKPLAIFAAGNAIVILLICYKMEADLGVFRLNTFDGWTLYGTAARYIDLTPEYRNNLRSNELKQLYEYFASYPETTYTVHSRDWNQWSPDSPSKRLLFYFIQQYRLDYYQAWIVVNDNLRQVAVDIVAHRPFTYFLHSYLPALANGIWPDMVLEEGGWPNYPLYQKPQGHDKLIQAYYNQNTENWGARYDIFPSLKPLFDIWVRALMPLFLVMLCIAVFSWKKLDLSEELPVVVILVAFVILYLLSVGATIYIYTRFLIPVTSVMIVLNVIGFDRIRRAFTVVQREPAIAIHQQSSPVKNVREA